MAKQEWTTQAVIQGARGRGFLIVVFWLWGLFGLLANCRAYLMLSGNIGVGTSTYLMLGALLWIGGMVLFGLGAAVLPGSYDFQRPEVIEK
jgi:hypothetical protein